MKSGSRLPPSFMLQEYIYICIIYTPNLGLIIVVFDQEERQDRFRESNERARERSEKALREHEKARRSIEKAKRKQ